MKTSEFWKQIKIRYNKTIYKNPKDFLEYNNIKCTKKILSYKW